MSTNGLRGMAGDQDAVAPLVILLILLALGVGVMSWRLASGADGLMQAVTWSVWAGFAFLAVLAYKKFRE